MAPPAPRSHKVRTALVVVASLAAIAVLAGVLANTADSGDPAKPAAKATAKPAAKPKVVLVPGRVTVESTGFPAAVTPKARKALLASTQQYFDHAIQAPIAGRPVDNGYAAAFAPAVRRPAIGKDRPVLTQAMGGTRGPVAVKASPVHFDALGEPTGKLALVATSFTVNIKTSTPARRPLTIRRLTELTFVHRADRWAVTAYRVTVQRKVGVKTTSTTALATLPAK